jgi:hypothetical protein
LTVINQKKAISNPQRPSGGQEECEPVDETGRAVVSAELPQKETLKEKAIHEFKEMIPVFF